MRFQVRPLGSPTKDHSIVVKLLKPGVPYTITVITPKVLTGGSVVTNGGTVTTHTRRVEVTGHYADVIDDSDNNSCGELNFFTFIGEEGRTWGGGLDP